MCSSLTHCCETWTLNRTVTRSIHGFNSSCLQVMTGEHYRETATAPAYDLVLAVCRCRMRYLGHVQRMSADRTVRCALTALVSDSVMYPRAASSVTARALRCHKLCLLGVFGPFLFYLRVSLCGGPIRMVYIQEVDEQELCRQIFFLNMSTVEGMSKAYVLRMQK